MTYLRHAGDRVLEESSVRKAVYLVESCPPVEVEGWNERFRLAVDGAELPEGEGPVRVHFRLRPMLSDLPESFPDTVYCFPINPAASDQDNLKKLADFVYRHAPVGAHSNLLRKPNATHEKDWRTFLPSPRLALLVALPALAYGAIRIYADPADYQRPGSTVNARVFAVEGTSCAGWATLASAIQANIRISGDCEQVPRTFDCLSNTDRRTLSVCLAATGPKRSVYALREANLRGAVIILDPAATTPDVLAHQIMHLLRGHVSADSRFPGVIAPVVNVFQDLLIGAYFLFGDYWWIYLIGAAIPFRGLVNRVFRG